MAEALAALPPTERKSFLEALLRETHQLVAFYDANEDMVVPEEAILDVPGEIGPYQQLRPIGEGSMGRVYEAWDPRRQRKVALKTIKPEFLVSGPRRQRFWKRFIHEARICRRLNHPNIVAMLDYIEDLRPYIVLEFVAGTTLDAHLQEGPMRDRSLVFSLINQVCNALAHAHHAGVIHRDLKPGNIMLTENQQAKLTDFGIGKLVGLRSLTNTGFLGTPLYASPEQITGGRLDHRADLFALALTVHVMITGRHPFRGETVEQTIFNLANKPPNLSLPHPALGLNPGLFRSFMNQALSKDPDKRYPDAHAFYVALYEAAV